MKELLFDSISKGISEVQCTIAKNNVCFCLLMYSYLLFVWGFNHILYVKTIFCPEIFF